MRIGVFCLFFFNVPLLMSWCLSQYYRHGYASEPDEEKKKEYLNLSYQWSTVFKKWYGFRLGLLAVGGLIFLIYIYNDNYTPNLFCDRYYGIDVDMASGVAVQSGDV